MPAVAASGKPAETKPQREYEEVQYIPEQRDRTFPLDVSVEDCETGEKHSAKLYPRRWTRVHKAIADMLAEKMQRGKQTATVPNGDSFDHTASGLSRLPEADRVVEEDSQGMNIVFKNREV